MFLAIGKVSADARLGKASQEVMRRKITGGSDARRIIRGSDAALQEAKRSQSAAQASLCLGRGQSHFVRPVPLCGERAAWPEDAAR
ncbi:hypothetical protein Y696_10960 [Mesotoga sp. H07pep.5.4]|nr:hypothetical protein Y696_10960 [Mesotoga sp. H07pep.5.4]